MQKSFSSFYKNAALYKYDNKNVVYIAHVGQHKTNDLFKYGKSTNVYQREYLSHRSNFDTFEMLFIGHTNHKDHVETIFEKELKLRNVHMQLEINKKKQTELFITNEDYPYDYFEMLMKDIIKYHNDFEYEHRKIYYEELKLKQLLAKVQLKELEYKIKQLQ